MQGWSWVVCLFVFVNNVLFPKGTNEMPCLKIQTAWSHKRPQG